MGDAMKLDMNNAWQQGMALVRANWQLLLVFAGLFLFLPSVAMTITMPEVFSGMAGITEPEEVNAWVLENWPQFAGVTAIAMFFQFIGYMAMIALIGSHRPTVGEALKIAIMSLPSMIAAFIIFVIAYVVLIGLLSLIIGLIAGGLAAAGLGEGGAVILVFILFIPLLIGQFYLMARLSMTMPAMVIERRLNPFGALSRSWSMTSRSGLRLLAFYALLTIAYFVILMVLSLFTSGVFGLAADASTATTGSAIVTGLLGAGFAMIFSGVIAAIYRQLAGPDAETMSETFE